MQVPKINRRPDGQSLQNEGTTQKRKDGEKHVTREQEGAHGIVMWFTETVCVRSVSRMVCGAAATPLYAVSFICLTPLLRFHPFFVCGVVCCTFVMCVFTILNVQKLPCPGRRRGSTCFCDTAEIDRR